MPELGPLLAQALDLRVDLCESVVSCLLKRGTPRRIPSDSSGKSEVVQPVLVDPEVVGELVEHGDPDLLLELGRVGKRLDERQPEDPDPVGERPGPVAPLGQRHALVEPEEVGVVGCSSSTEISTFRIASRSSAGSEAERALDVLLERQ